MGSPRTAPERHENEGAIGIGTMIVFIAMVIVAAVAAAVLINTAGSLQRQAASTGQETSQEVSGNIFVRDIVGNVTDNANDGDAIERVEYYLSLAPGSDPVDLTQLVVRWEHGNDLADLQHVDNVDGVTQCDYDTNFSLATGHFCVETILDPGDGSANVLSEGDRTKILVTLDDSNDEEIGVRESVSTLLIPERGTPVDAGFDTPATFSGRSNLSLK